MLLVGWHHKWCKYPQQLFEIHTIEINGIRTHFAHHPWHSGSNEPCEFLRSFDRLVCVPYERISYTFSWGSPSTPLGRPAVADTNRVWSPQLRESQSPPVGRNVSLPSIAVHCGQRMLHAQTTTRDSLRRHKNSRLRV